MPNSNENPTGQNPLGTALDLTKDAAERLPGFGEAFPTQMKILEGANFVVKALDFDESFSSYVNEGYSRLGATVGASLELGA